ncbi:zinc ribbon-containing protein [Algibacillus agarilyticus]|uniref:zinc ribbon-containing protein n=1 Tax=Algibacillus agarilyticus TaxID=2234133 RepID=UPI000DCF8565|nr:hypothetical protein [Algibacillus agarilyticus]
MSELNTYQKLIQKFDNWLNDIEQHEVKDIVEGIDLLKDWAQTGISVNTEDAQEQVKWLQRDLLTFYQDYRAELKESAYVRSLNDHLWHTLAQITDNTQLEWRNLASDFQHDGIYSAGEEIAIGELQCQHCAATKTIEYVQKLAPCANCNHQHYIKTN